MLTRQIPTSLDTSAPLLIISKMTEMLNEIELMEVFDDDHLLILIFSLLEGKQTFHEAVTGKLHRVPPNQNIREYL